MFLSNHTDRVVVKLDDGDNNMVLERRMHKARASLHVLRHHLDKNHGLRKQRSGWCNQNQSQTLRTRRGKYKLALIQRKHTADKASSHLPNLLAETVGPDSDIGQPFGLLAYWFTICMVVLYVDI